MRRNYQRLAAACVLVLVALAVCAPLARAGGSDWDSDGIRNTLDNCMKQPNPTQTDLDGDGQGDVCDPDRDGDGQLDAKDPCPDDPLDGCVAPPPPAPPDTTPPETTIDKHPNALTNSTSATFEFSSNEANSTFQCKVDGGSYASCSSPETRTGLSEGSHTFYVKATDAAGNTDATEASYTWSVDTTPPETTVTAGPSEGDTITQANTSLSFSSSEAKSTFSCQLDGGAPWTCTSPQTLSGLSNASHTFEVKATDAAGNTDATPARRTWTVEATTQSGTDPVMVGAGDIANCSNLAGAEATAKLLDTIPGTVYTLGDNAYGSGTSSEFANCYDPTWGRHMARTRPAPGNHEYYTAGASGYFGYFGSAAGDPSRGYYSYELGQWHVVVLNTNDQCKYVSCAAGSEQANWLQADLAAHPTQCTLAYFHYPLFTSGNYSPGISAVKPLWDVLYSGGAEVVLNGHDHLYERFAPQSPSGVPDPGRGIREFVVGTGGAEHYGIKTVQPTSEVRNTGTFGVLKLTLHPTSYDWEFVPEAGKTFTDSGTTSCH